MSVNALDVKAAEVILKYLTYVKVGAILGATIIGFVYIAKSHPGTAAYENLHNSFAGSGEADNVVVNSQSAFDLLLETNLAQLSVAVIVCLWTYDGTREALSCQLHASHHYYRVEQPQLRRARAG